MDLKISICIPTWEQHGFGCQYLKELLDTIKTQTYKNFNVVISDHSVNDEIRGLTIKYLDDFEIIYIRNPKNIGNGPANTNSTLKNANGDIIKVMFQDDLFFNNDSLKIINEKFKNDNCKWLVNGCNHTNDGKTFNREMVPSWNDELLNGVNTISSPSVLSFINDDIILFDEDLVMLMDCEYYYRLHKKYGLPLIVKDILISNRMHQHQISAMYSRSLQQEINHVKIKHE